MTLTVLGLLEAIIRSSYPSLLTSAASICSITAVPIGIVIPVPARSMTGCARAIDETIDRAMATKTIHIPTLFALFILFLTKY